VRMTNVAAPAFMRTPSLQPENHMHSFARCAFTLQNATFFASGMVESGGRHAHGFDADNRASWREVLYVG
jgi:hypothetical protein